MGSAQRALPEGLGQWTHDGYSLNSLAGRRLRSSEEPFSRSGDPSNTSYLRTRGNLLVDAARGSKADALACLADEWTRAVWEDYFGPLTMAEGFALIGERAESIRWLGVPASLGSAPLAVTSVP